MIKLKNTAVMISMGLLMACGGSTKKPSPNDGSDSPQISNLEKKLPFNLDDETGKFFQLYASLASIAIPADFRRSIDLNDFVRTHKTPHRDTGFEYVDSLLLKTCRDHGSIQISHNLPPTPWLFENNNSVNTVHTNEEAPRSNLSFGPIRLNPIEFNVSATDCFSKRPDIGGQKFLDGSVNVKYEDEKKGLQLLEKSTIKYSNYSIGYKSVLQATKAIDKNTLKGQKRLNLLLSGTRKVVITKDIDPQHESDVEGVRTIFITDEQGKTTIKHPSGDEFIIENKSYTVDKEKGLHSEYTISWEVTNTVENIELLNHKYLKRLLPQSRSRYGKDYVFPKGSYRLHYTFDHKYKTGRSLITVDLPSHHIKADIVITKEHTDITFNRNGIIKKVRVN